MDNWGVSDKPLRDPMQHPHLEAGDERGVTPSAAAGPWPWPWPPLEDEEDIFFDWDALYGPQDQNQGLENGPGTSLSSLDSLQLSQLTPLRGVPGEHSLTEQNTQDTPGVIPQAQGQAQTSNTHTPLILPGFNNVAEWLDGAYRPPTPCDHCRRHKLQCLILRRTSDNPNPVPSCSSCVGLFRPCSFGRGEKRQASGFETLSPVLGHLHGVIEEGEGNEGQGGSGSGTATAPREQSLKETKQFVRRGARVLREWFYLNEERPYPSEEEKGRLALETGFSRQRVSTWFANARRRQKQQRQVESSMRIYRAGSPMPMSMPMSMAMPVSDDAASMTPMERWQVSPPGEEPVSEDVIREAIATSAGSDVDGDLDSPSIDPSSAGERSSFASSRSSFGVASDTSDSSSSAWSFRSGESLRPRSYRRTSAGRRGGRRRVTEDGHYQCTFCTQSFKKKHDWSRHEKSVHLPLDVWICTPNLNELQPTDIFIPECRFCGYQSPSSEHWESHDFGECATKPLSERSFSRKDYLWQHLRKFHGCTQYPVPNLDSWRSSQNEIQSRCGFCTAHLPSWSARADHLAAHFKEGCRMSQWAGDWGFDSSVLISLRNAVLPFERP